MGLTGKFFQSEFFCFGGFPDLRVELALLTPDLVFRDLDLLVTIDHLNLASLLLDLLLHESGLHVEKKKLQASHITGWFTGSRVIPISRRTAKKNHLVPKYILSNLSNF